MAKRKRGVPLSAADLVAPAKNGRHEAMAKIAGQMKGWKPARQVLRKVEAVPTIFPSFDKGTHVGGLPLGRIITIHGPSGEGKTYFTLGLECSFLAGDHFVAHVDAEMTTPVTWVDKIMSQVADHPGYLASRPRNYEEVDDAVRSFLNNIGEAKSKGTISKETSGLVVVDSIRKLVPKALFAKLMSAKGGAKIFGIDGMSGRGAQHKAALHAQWMDEMVPLLESTNCSMVLIARETEDPEADANARKYGRAYKIGGGKSVIYDSSITARITRKSWVQKTTGKQHADGSDVKEAIGERHQVEIWRTKVTVNEDKATKCFFHTSNGTFVPEGFDRARDVLELAREMQIVKGDASLSFDGKSLGRSENRSVLALANNPELLAEIEARVRAGFVIEGAPAEGP